MTDAIHCDWKQHVAKTTSRVGSENKSFAICCLPGSNPTPVVIMATPAERTRAFWQDIMWSAVLSEEFQAGCGDEEFERAVRPFYANVNPQTALAASIDHRRLPGLSRFASISNAGLGEIQPDASRGRVRYLVLVSDSFTVSLAGKHTVVDLAGDLIEQVSSGVMNNYRAVVYRPMWGKTLPILVSQAKTAVEELWAGIKDEPWAYTVEI